MLTEIEIECELITEDLQINKKINHNKVCTATIKNFLNENWMMAR